MPAGALPASTGRGSPGTGGSRRQREAGRERERQHVVKGSSDRLGSHVTASLQVVRPADGTARAELWQDRSTEPLARRGAGERMEPPRSAACIPAQRPCWSGCKGKKWLLAPWCSTAGHGHTACTIIGGNQTCDKPCDGDARDAAADHCKVLFQVHLRSPSLSCSEPLLHGLAEITHQSQSAWGSGAEQFRAICCLSIISSHAYKTH